jgi:hypothetical protein
MSEPDIQKLLKYSHYLDGIRSRGSAYKKLYYNLLYLFIIPLFRFLKPFIKVFVSKISKTSCDILVLGTCNRDVSGSEQVWTALSDRGYKVSRTYMRKKSEFFKHALKTTLKDKIPACFYLQACYARYLVQKYQPKLMVVFYSYDILPSFLRKEMQGVGKTVYMPHAVIPTTYLFTSLDYDYYFAFGKSSVDNILLQKLRIGNTRVICAGSPMIQKNFSLPASTVENKNILYFSNWMIGVDPDYTRDFEIVLNWAKEHPEFNLLIKSHPVESNNYVSNASAGIPNISFLDPCISIRDALAKAAIGIVAFSVASLESALLNRPVVVANFRELIPDSEDGRISDKFLFLEKYFPPRARTSDELNERILEVRSRYDYYVDQCRHFVKRHLEYETESGEKITSLLENIFQGKVPETCMEINETLEGLK